MTFSTLLVERDGPIGRVVLHRPATKNSITLEMVHELPRAFDQLSEDDDVSVVILKGAGTAFSAGFDHSVNPAACGFVDALSEVTTSRRWLSGLFRIWDCPKVVIAQLHGWAVGWGGLPPLFCDLRYASDEFKVFCTAGVTGAHLPEIWSWFVGPTAAAEFCFRPGHRFGSEELCRLGLLNEVVPLADLEAHVEGVAREIATTHTSFTRFQKLALHRRFELQGLREQVLASKEIDAILHWSKLGQANLRHLQNALGGDRRKLAAAQEGDPAYWADLAVQEEAEGGSVG
jgi:enoyl-CoA hydratase/carnithine racemase